MAVFLFYGDNVFPKKMKKADGIIFIEYGTGRGEGDFKGDENYLGLNNINLLISPKL